MSQNPTPPPFEQNNFERQNFEQGNVVNSLPCRFAHPKSLFWGAFIGLCTSAFLYTLLIWFSLFFVTSVVNPVTMPFALSIGKTLVSGDASWVFEAFPIANIFAIISMALIATLLFFFAKGFKNLNFKLYGVAKTLLILHIAGFVMTSALLQGIIEYLNHPNLIYIYFYTLIGLGIALVICFYKIGKILSRQYEGPLKKLGKSILTFCIFGTIIIFCLILFLVSLELNLGFNVTKLTSLFEFLWRAIVSFLFLSTIPLMIFTLFYLYFEIYYKMAKILRPCPDE